MKAKQLFIIMIAALFALIFVHLGFSVSLGIISEIKNLDSSLALASRTIAFVVEDDLKEIDRIVLASPDGSASKSFLPKGADPMELDQDKVRLSDPLPKHGNWYVLSGETITGALIFARRAPEGYPAAFIQYRPDLSWADYLLPDIKDAELRIVGSDGSLLWGTGQPVLISGEHSPLNKPGTSGGIWRPVYTRKVDIGPGGLILELIFPAMPFVYSALSRLPWTLGVELLLIMGLLAAWIVFSRYLLDPLERVTRLSLQMQDRLFTSTSPADLAEGVSKLAGGIRDLTRNSRLSEVKVFCQTLSSALQGYVFQQEKIMDSGKELEKANRALSEANRDLLRRDEIWRKILEVSRSVTIESGFQKGLERVALILAEMAGAYGVVIGRIEGGNMVALAWSGFDGMLEIRSAPLDSSIIGRALDSGAPVWTENVHSDPSYCQLNRRIKSELNIPMFHIGKAVGGLSIAWDQVRSEDRALVELVMPVALHVAGLLNTQASLLDLKNSYKYMAGRLQNLTAIYHDETAAHLERMEHYCRFLSVAMSRSLVEVEDVALFSRLHDIGKLKVPMEILSKPGGLNHAEFEIVKHHTEWGAEILGDASWLQMGRNICLYHHEKWDGNGYPEGLSGENIPWEARIVALADAYDALRSPRSYKPPYSHLEAVRIILQGDQRLKPEHFDPLLLDLFRKFHHRMAEIYETIGDEVQDTTAKLMS
ncbi:MAG TPA: HD domain-containing protein [Synergistetes bacterium]|nr:HD domain-containing protein [Synergistota bacterium]